jgi:hypothetical protein
MGINERKTRRGDWTPLELFIAGCRAGKKTIAYYLKAIP